MVGYSVVHQREVGTRFASLIFANMRLVNLVPTSRWCVVLRCFSVDISKSPLMVTKFLESIDHACYVKKLQELVTACWMYSANKSVFKMQAISSIVSALHLERLVQERLKSIANALELSLSCTNPSICRMPKWQKPKQIVDLNLKKLS